MNHVISMCCWRRPDYCRRIWNAFSKCWGIHKYTLLVHIDGGTKESKSIARLARTITCCKVEVFPKKKHIGCNRNTFQALASGFKQSDYVIHFEDDILPAEDALCFFEWGRQFEANKHIMTVGIWPHLRRKKGKPKDPNYLMLAGLSPGIHIWGWATWKDRWIEFKRKWTTKSDHELSWDTQLAKNVRGNRCALVPFVSRAQNIGATRGTHRGACMLEYWAKGEIKSRRDLNYRLKV